MNGGRSPAPTGFSVRQATEADLDALAAVEAASFGGEAWSRAQLADGLAAAGAHWWVPAGERPGSALTAYAAFQRAADEAELLRVAVIPRARRRGVGAVLVAAGLERLRTEGVASCFLEVAEDNRPALALYRRLGFRPAGSRPSYYRRGADALLLRVDLGVCPPSGRVLSSDCP